MLQLLKKNSFYFLLYILPILSLMTLYMVLKMKEIDTTFILFQSQWLLLLAVGSLGVNENSEEKNGGYYFLRNLPLTANAIVTAKFLMSFLAIVFLMGFNFLLHILVPGSAYLQKMGRIFVLISSNTALIICALMYLVILKFGFSTFQKIAWGLLIPLMILPIILLELEFASKIDVSAIIQALGASEWWIWLVLSFFVCIFCYGIKLAAEKALIKSYE